MDKNNENIEITEENIKLEKEILQAYYYFEEEININHR